LLSLGISIVLLARDCFQPFQLLLLSSDGLLQRRDLRLIRFVLLYSLATDLGNLDISLFPQLAGQAPCHGDHSLAHASLALTGTALLLFQLFKYL